MKGRQRLPPPNTTVRSRTPGIHRPSRPAGFRVIAGKSLRSGAPARSEEHTSELQSRRDLVCRLLLEKKQTTGSGEASGSGISTGAARSSNSCSWPFFFFFKERAPPEIYPFSLPPPLPI